MRFEYFHVDRLDPDLPLHATRYKTLRLTALEQSPASFSSTLDTESQFSDDVWLSRLHDSSKETFICANVSDDQYEWVAQVILRGPISEEEFRLPKESGQSSADSDEKQVKWQMLSLFTLPKYRGQALGKRLCQEAFKYLTLRYQSEPSLKQKDVLVRIMVKPDNQAVVNMWKSLGFIQTGFCTLEEALRANGDAEMIPEGALPAQFTTRGGLIMALTVEK